MGLVIAFAGRVPDCTNIVLTNENEPHGLPATPGRRKANLPRGVTKLHQPDLTLVLDASNGCSVNPITEPAGQLNFNASLRSRHAHLAPTHDFKEEIACPCAITPSFRSSPPCCSPVAPAITDLTMTTIARWVIRKP
ncbi:hypothetical protein J0G12_19630 [Stutzerimonas stutzeri]